MLKNQEVVFGNYFYGNLYARDTIRLDNAGHGVLSGDKILPEGMYILMTGPNKYFDFIISNDRTFDINIKDTLNFTRNIIFSGAQQTEAFQNYGTFISQQREASTAAYEQFKTTGDSAYFQKVQDINDSVIEYQKNTIEQFQGTTIGTILHTLQNTPTPLFEEIANDTLRQKARYYHYRNHYWDNIDLSSQALLYSPFLKQKIETFLNETLVKNPDTIAVQVVNMIERNGESHVVFGTGVFYLEHAYERDAQEALREAEAAIGGDNNPNGNVFKQATDYCDPLAKQYGWGYSKPYFDCIMSELSKHPEMGELEDIRVALVPPASVYRVDFASPIWFPSLAGWLVLICLLMTVVIIIRFFIWVILKVTLIFMKKR